MLMRSLNTSKSFNFLRIHHERYIPLMHILIVTQYFWPENFKINDLALELRNKGHEVTILTGQPNYPEGKFFKGYSFAKPSFEKWNGIDIIRLPTVSRGMGNPIKLILNYISFPFFGRILWRNRLKGRIFDLIFICQLSPVFVALPAISIKKHIKLPLAMWVLDLWPESVFAASNVKPFFLEKPLKAIVKYIYHSCDLILISSQSFNKSVSSFGVPAERIEYFPNWAEQMFLSKQALEYKGLPGFPEGFIVLFAGNIGEAQDIETILEAAEKLRDHKNIKWIFLGDGRKRIWLQNEIKIRDMADQILWLGRYPSNTMPYFYSQASVMLASLKKNFAFELTVPAKLQTYMASRKPVISSLSGEGNQIVQKSNCGFNVPSGDSKLLSEAVFKMSKLPKSELDHLANNGYQYYLENFDKDLLLNKLESTLINLVDNCHSIQSLR
jgi:colanic acid biosynthesis glycosyl transferase WcaI